MVKSLDLNHHMVTSAKDNSNIDELFITLAKHLYHINSDNLMKFKGPDGPDDF